jgi:hypothetical protein
VRWPWRRDKGQRVVFIGGSPPPPAPVVPPPPPPAPSVQLGFSDGSTMELDDDDPRAVALRAAAARLTGSK